MSKYLLDLIRFNGDETEDDYNSKTKLSIISLRYSKLKHVGQRINFKTNIYFFYFKLNNLKNCCIQCWFSSCKKINRKYGSHLLLKGNHAKTEHNDFAALCQNP